MGGTHTDTKSFRTPGSIGMFLGSQAGTQKLEWFGRGLLGGGGEWAGTHIFSHFRAVFYYEVLILFLLHKYDDLFFLSQRKIKQGLANNESIQYILTDGEQALWGT